MHLPTWAAGLPARTSARRAMRWGGIACLIQALRVIVGMAITLAVSGKTPGHAIVWTMGAGVVPMLFAIAGIRLLRGQGRLSGSAAAVILILDFGAIAAEPATILQIGPVMVRLVLLAFIVNGVRGALALHHLDYDQPLRDTFD